MIQTPWLPRLLDYLGFFSAPRYKVLVFPEFERAINPGDVINRARWYLPKRGMRNVTLRYAPSPDDSKLVVPNHSPAYQHKQMRLVESNRTELRRRLRGADLILVWEQQAVDEARRLAGKRSSVVVVSHHPGSREFSKWASINWKLRLTGRSKNRVRADSLKRLRQKLDSIEPHQRRFSLVMGTGPSFENFRYLDRSGGVVIACNSAVHHYEFLTAFRPDFLCFGDSAHHAGVSRKSALFREDLLRALESLPNLFVLTTDKLYGVLGETLSGFSQRVAWLPQRGTEPNFDLLAYPRLPLGASVMQIHMLPLAATVSREILVIGAEGSHANKAEDDFWGHAPSLNYSKHLNDFHQAHPTYGSERSVQADGSTGVMDRYHEGFEELLVKAEVADIRIQSLSSSSIRGIRKVPVSKQFASGPAGSSRVSLLEVVSSKRS